MTRVTSQKIRQALLVTGDPLDPDELPEKLQLFDEDGNPQNFGGYARDSITHATASLAPGATENSVFTVFPGWRAFRMYTNRPARVRIYPTAALRTADAARPVGVKPAGNSGRLLEMVTTVGVTLYYLSPAVDFSSDGAFSSDFYIAVTNLDGAAGSVQTTFDYVRTE